MFENRNILFCILLLFVFEETLSNVEKENSLTSDHQSLIPKEKKLFNEFPQGDDQYR